MSDSVGDKEAGRALVTLAKFMNERNLGKLVMPATADGKRFFMVTVEQIDRGRLADAGLGAEFSGEVSA